MGFFDTLSKRKNRQPGGAKAERAGSSPRPRARLHPKVHEAMELLGGQPDLDDDELADLLGLTPDAAGPFIWRPEKRGRRRPSCESNRRSCDQESQRRPHPVLGSRPCRAGMSHW
jgi:hypothetical protein